MSLERSLVRVRESFLNQDIFFYPTETVWGLGCDALSKEAVLKIFALKQRQDQKPLSLLVRDQHMAFEYAETSFKVQKLLSVLWPGPISVVLPAKKSVPDWIHKGTQCVSLRCSPHPFLEKLFQALPRPLVTTSANRSGSKPLLKREDVVRQFPSCYSVEGEESFGRTPSTVIKIKEHLLEVLRVGDVSKEDLLGLGFKVV